MGVVLNIDRTETEVAACVCDSSLSSPHSSFRSPAMLARRSMSRSTRSPPFSSRPAQLFNWETGQAKLPHSFTQNTTLWGREEGGRGGRGVPSYPAPSRGGLSHAPFVYRCLTVIIEQFFSDDFSLIKPASISLHPHITASSLLTLCIRVPGFPSPASCSSQAHPEQVETKRRSR